MATLGARLWSRGAFRHSPNAFILASMVSGFAWYFTSQRCKDITNQKKELIRRVQSGQTAENFKSTFDYHKAEDFECRKVNLDGILGQGRFFVKRSRGKQEGYYVLAPFTVNAYHTEHNIISPEKFHMHTIKRKFILNLGWIPRSRKHLVYENFPSDFIPEELCADRQEAMEKQRKDGIIRDPLIPDILAPVTNVTAYVRRGQVQDKVNGRVNQQERYLYKWIDLNLLTRAFRVFNEEEGETVYLDRAVKTADQPESFPLVATKESLIEDLNTQIKHSQKYANVAAKGISGLAFGAAAWITFF